ncbi:hypothetical protein ACH4D5_23635 [Streptomyces sp. NPDC018029]|uniref:hypothetical protein n=1 Tax=Streptomyces sp. NPDC018029 TaxID=3365032 RepID=UPI00378ABABB
MALVPVLFSVAFLGVCPAALPASVSVPLFATLPTRYSASPAARGPSRLPAPRPALPPAQRSFPLPAPLSAQFPTPAAATPHTAPHPALPRAPVTGARPRSEARQGGEGRPAQPQRDLARRAARQGRHDPAGLVVERPGQGGGAQVAQRGVRAARADMDIGALDEAAAVRNGAGERRGEVTLRRSEVPAVRGRAAQPVQGPGGRGAQAARPLELGLGGLDIPAGEPHPPHPGPRPRDDPRTPDDVTSASAVP